MQFHVKEKKGKKCILLQKGYFYSQKSGIYIDQYEFKERRFRSINAKF